MMRLPKVRDCVLPIYLLAFAGPAVAFLRPVFNITTRWMVLGCVVAYLVTIGRLANPLRTGFGFFTLIFALWAFATGGWSEVPELSLAKACAFLLISLAGLAIGQCWMRDRSLEDALKYLGPLTIVSLLAGLLGQATGQGNAAVGDIETYRGLTGNSNMFGSLLAMCSPFLAYQVLCTWTHWRRRAFWLILVAIGLYYLFASTARASILAALCTWIGLFLVLGHVRKVLLLTLFGVGLASVLLIAPQELQIISNQFIYKGQATERGATYSRDEVWQESYDAAVEGGWTGGGYGVTIGAGDFQGALTTVGYSREKGNSQLAIAEETGLIGLFIYSISLVLLFVRLGRAALRLPRGLHKALLGIVIGTLVGMVVQSMFEAWWDAPASVESVYFWVLAGIALALSDAKCSVSASRVNLSHGVDTSHLRIRNRLR